jgi:hypothetical protein
MDIKKPTKTRQAKRVEYVVLELAVQPRPSYSIQRTSVVDASRPFMLLAAEQLMKMRTRFVPPATQQRQSKSKMKTISLTHLDLFFGVPSSLSPLSSHLQQQQEQQGQRGRELLQQQ